MNCWCRIIVFLVIPILLAFGGFLWFYEDIVPEPRFTIETGRHFWGHGSQREDDSTIIPFQVNITADEISDLKSRLKKTRFSTPLSGEATFEYGFHGGYLREVVNHWLNKYDWFKHQAHINSYPHYKVEIEGIKIHYVHASPPKIKPGKFFNCEKLE